MKKAPPEKRSKTSASEPRRVAAKPRKRGGNDDYDYGDMGNTGGTRGSRGNKILSPEANRVQLWRPTWDKNIPTTVRILPTVDPEDTAKLLGYRKSAGHSKFTAWCFGAPATQFVGIDEKFSFLLYNPTWIRSRNYDPGSNPYQILFDEFHAALKNEEARLGKRDVLTKKWYGLGVKSENQKRRAFTRVNPMHFYRVFMYAHKDKYLIDPKTGLPFGAGKKDPTIVLQVAKSGGEALQSRLNRKNEGVSEDAPYNKLFEFGDITGLKFGKFVTFLGPDHINSLDFSKYGVKVTDDDEEGPDLGDDGDDADDDGGDDNFNKRWRVHIHREFTYVTKKKKRRKLEADISALRNTVLEKYEWWEDILNFPSHEEICIWLAQGFRSMPDVIRYGWRDNKEFLTDEVKGILAARTQGPGAEVPTDEDEEEDEGEEGEEGEDEGEEEGEEEEAPRRKKKKKNVRASSVAEDDEEEDEGGDEEEDEGEDEDESEDEDEGEDESEDEDEGEDEGEDEEGDESEDEEEDEPPPPRKNKKVKVKAKKRREAEAEDESEDEGEDEEGDESSSNGDEESALKRAKKAALERAARRGNKPGHKVKIKKKIKS